MDEVIGIETFGCKLLFLIEIFATKFFYFRSSLNPSSYIFYLSAVFL